LLVRLPARGLPKRAIGHGRATTRRNHVVLRLAEDDDSSSRPNGAAPGGVSAFAAAAIDATVVSKSSSSSSSNGGGDKEPGSGWVAKLRALPASVKSSIVALFAAFAQLASVRKWRSALTPGRSGGSNNPLTRLLLKLPVKQQLLVRRLAVPVASTALFFFLNFGGHRAAKPPPPREIAYSEFFRVVEKSPKALYTGVVMGPGRWDFAVALPLDHPLPGTPLAGVSPEAATAAAALGQGSPATAAAAPVRPKALPAALVAAPAGSEASGGGYKAVRLFTRPVGPANQPVPADVLALLLKQEVGFTARPPAALGALSKVLFPVAYLAMIFYFYSKTMGGNAAGNVGSRVLPGALPAGSGFDGVAGLGQAKFDVAEIVNMLRDPARWVCVEVGG
jgi:hypothetical protein